jgi:hypothetical protein
VNLGGGRRAELGAGGGGVNEQGRGQKGKGKGGNNAGSAATIAVRKGNN